MGALRTVLVAMGALALSAGGVAGQDGGGRIDWGLLKTPDPVGAYAKGYQLGQRMAADRAAQARADAEAGQRAAESDQALRDRQLQADRAKEAGRLIASGRCGDARAYALDEGDLDLATRVTALCSGK